MKRAIDEKELIDVLVIVLRSEGRDPDMLSREHFDAIKEEVRNELYLRNGVYIEFLKYNMKGVQDEVITR